MVPSVSGGQSDDFKDPLHCSAGNKFRSLHLPSEWVTTCEQRSLAASRIVKAALEPSLVTLSTRITVDLLRRVQMQFDQVADPLEFTSVGRWVDGLGARPHTSVN